MLLPLLPGVGGAVRFLVVGTIGKEERPPRGQLWMEHSRCRLPSVVNASNALVGKFGRDGMAISSGKLSFALHLPTGKSC